MKAQVWHRIWASRGPWAIVLWPVSMVFRGLLALRRQAYEHGWLVAHQLPVPLIVVGNVMVGGVGKTPVTMALVQGLSRAGWQVGVISRGHGRRASQAMLVRADSDSSEVGDEPLLIQRRTGVPVAVAASRLAAARLLLSQHPQVNLLIADDGMQHGALRADLVLCVFDQRRIGNGWLLPAGPLREPWPLRGQQRPPTWLLSSENPPWHDAWPIRRSLDEQAINGLGERCHLSQLPTPVFALAAIAQPGAFFQSLRQRGVKLDTTLALPDHDDLLHWHPLPGQCWLCTEKDAVKIWGRYPAVWAIPLRLELPGSLFAQLGAFLPARLSSPHGQETT